MRTRRLIVVTPEGERTLLFVGRLAVGRAPECDISLADTKISRRHAEFDASGPSPRVTDLGSRNGILVNGRKVGAADLVPGDVVTVGDAQIRFEERVVEMPERVTVAPLADDRTAVMPPPVGPPGGLSAPPPVAAPLPPAPSPVGASRADVQGPAQAVPVDPDKTMVMGRPGLAGGTPAPAVPAAVPFDDEAEPPTIRTTAPRPMPAPVVSPAAGPPSPVVPAASPRPQVGPPAIAQAAPPVAPPAAPRPPSPAAVAPPPSPAAEPSSGPRAASAEAAAPKGPRFSWGGVVTLAAVVLGGLAVLLGALPLISASAGTLDALSQRQARTLAGWLAAGVDPQASPVVDAGVLESVLTQPGVDRALVLERATGRAVAPAALVGRSFDELPGIGTGWKDIDVPQVGRVDGFADAYAPAGGGAFVAWVRYERPSSGDTGVAVIVALIATLVLAMLTAMLIKRHTRATLQHFTRQVELAVSGASPRVMQGGLIPGLERLPGVVTYLLERRGASAGTGASGSGLVETDDPDLWLAPVPAAPVPVDPGPPWLEVTPSLLVAEASAHGPSGGAPGWASARGRHLLDVLDDTIVRNAVVQGLGALGMQPGAETTVPIAGGPPVVLGRAPSGHVRVTLGAR